MRAFLGVDLGSTTTKAVLVGEDGTVRGRGLTNTRASFDAALAAARAEAEADARLARFSDLLAEAGATPARLKHARRRVRAAWRRAAFAARLARLRARLRQQGAPAGAAPAAVAAAETVLSHLDAIAERPPDDAFFADTVTASAARAAERLCAAGETGYEEVMGVIDRVLMADEADPSVPAPAELLASWMDGDARDGSARSALSRALDEPIDLVAVAGTGYGRHRLPFARAEVRSEIVCHGLGAHQAFPHTRTVLDIGGQDTKAIRIDERGLVTSFQMNDRCAAGCGRYLGYVAEELDLPLGDLGPLALRAERPSRINSTCTVFASAEIRERLALGEGREDVVAGLHRAIARRALSLLARAGGAEDQLTFSGGVARNPAVVRFVGEELGVHYPEVALNVSPDSIFCGAIGAALLARMDSPAALPARMGFSPRSGGGTEAEARPA